MIQEEIDPIAHSGRLHVHSVGTFHTIVPLVESTRDPQVEYLRVQIVVKELGVEVVGIGLQIVGVEKQVFGADT